MTNDDLAHMLEDIGRSIEHDCEPMAYMRQEGWYGRERFVKRWRCRICGYAMFPVSERD